MLINREMSVWRKQEKAALHRLDHCDCSRCRQGKMLNRVYCCPSVQLLCRESLIAKAKRARVPTSENTGAFDKQGTAEFLVFKWKQWVFCRHSCDSALGKLSQQTTSILTSSTLDHQLTPGWKLWKEKALSCHCFFRQELSSFVVN